MDFYKTPIKVILLAAVAVGLYMMISKFIIRDNRDNYGGLTPENTKVLLIDALKKGDIDLASKYFTSDRQKQWKRTFEEYDKQGLIGNFELELEDNQKIEFQKYPNGIWKIEML